MSAAALQMLTKERERIQGEISRLQGEALALDEAIDVISRPSRRPLRPGGKAGSLLEAMASIGRPMRVPELAEATGIGRGYMAVLLQRMVASGSVKRVHHGLYALPEVTQ